MYKYTHMLCIIRQHAYYHSHCGWNKIIYMNKVEYIDNLVLL